MNGNGKVPLGRPISPAAYGVFLTLMIQLVAIVAFLVTIKAQGSEMQRTIARIEASVMVLDRDIDNVTERVARLEGVSP